MQTSTPAKIERPALDYTYLLRAGRPRFTPKASQSGCTSQHVVYHTGRPQIDPWVPTGTGWAERSSSLAGRARVQATPTRATPGRAPDFGRDPLQQHDLPVWDCQSCETARGGGGGSERGVWHRRQSGAGTLLSVRAKNVGARRCQGQVQSYSHLRFGRTTDGYTITKDRI